MKNIKELEKYKKDLEDDFRVLGGKRRLEEINKYESKIQTLKDVVKLIDGIKNIDYKWDGKKIVKDMIDRQELKQKLTGNNEEKKE